MIKQILEPDESTAYSWTDPERSNTKKVLCCNLNLVNQRNEGGKQPKPLQKLEIELDNLEYRQAFIGRFINDNCADLAKS